MFKIELNKNNSDDRVEVETAEATPETGDALVTKRDQDERVPLIMVSEEATTVDTDQVIAKVDDKPDEYKVPAYEEVLRMCQSNYFCLDSENGIYFGEYAQMKERTNNDAAKPLKLSRLVVGMMKIRRFVREFYPGIDDKAIASEFPLHPATTLYKGIEFQPMQATPGYLNLYEGPVISPVEGDCTEIERFLSGVVCDGDHQAYEYLCGFLAHLYQRPEEKPGVFIVLIGGQGTGKGTFCYLVQQIWKTTYLQVNKAEMVVGKFNDILERSLIVAMDEALFSGDRRDTDRLKSLVTEPELVIEAKYQPKRVLQSYHRFIMTTNAKYAKHTENDDRRDLTLRVSEMYKDDHGYWQQLRRDINPSTLAAFAYKLAHYDLSTFNVRNVPVTVEKTQQKILSLAAIESYWLQYLQDRDEDWPQFIASNDLLEGVLNHGGHFHRKPNVRDIVQRVKILCPSATPDQCRVHGLRVRGLTLPSLEQARAEFSTWIGGDIAW